MGLKYRAVLFDLDDTLFDHQRQRRDALATLAKAAGLPPDTDLLALERVHDRHLERTHRLQYAGELSLEQSRLERMKGTLLEFGISADDQRLQELEDLYRVTYEREWQTVPGAVELLDALRGAGARIVLITNGRMQDQYPKMKRLGLSKWLDHALVSEEVGCEKPSRQFFELALAHARCLPSECVVVGDLWHIDIIGAHQMGIASIWLNRYAHPRGSDANPIEITSYLPLDQTLRHFTLG